MLIKCYSCAISLPPQKYEQKQFHCRNQTKLPSSTLQGPNHNLNSIPFWAGKVTLPWYHFQILIVSTMQCKTPRNTLDIWSVCLKCFEKGLFKTFMAFFTTLANVSVHEVPTLLYTSRLKK